MTTAQPIPAHAAHVPTCRDTHCVGCAPTPESPRHERRREAILRRLAQGRVLDADVAWLRGVYGETPAPDSEVRESVRPVYAVPREHPLYGQGPADEPALPGTRVAVRPADEQSWTVRVEVPVAGGGAETDQATACGVAARVVSGWSDHPARITTAYLEALVDSVVYGAQHDTHDAGLRRLRLDEALRIALDRPAADCPDMARLTAERDALAARVAELEAAITYAHTWLAAPLSSDGTARHYAARRLAPFCRAALAAARATPPEVR